MSFKSLVSDFLLVSQSDGCRASSCINMFLQISSLNNSSKNVTVLPSLPVPVDESHPFLVLPDSGLTQVLVLAQVLAQVLTLVLVQGA